MTEIYTSQFWRLDIQDRVPAWWGESPVPGFRLRVVSSYAEVSQELCGVCFLKAVILFMRASLS